MFSIHCSYYHACNAPFWARYDSSLVGLTWFKYYLIIFRFSSMNWRSGLTFYVFIPKYVISHFCKEIWFYCFKSLFLFMFLQTLLFTYFLSVPYCAFCSGYSSVFHVISSSFKIFFLFLEFCCFTFHILLFSGHHFLFSDHLFFEFFHLCSVMLLHNYNCSFKDLFLLVFWLFLSPCCHVKLQFPPAFGKRLQMSISVICRNWCCSPSRFIL